MGTYQTRLRELRNAVQMSQEATAARIGISKISYQRYETGERDIPGDVLLRMADFFGVSSDYIMMATDDPSRTRRSEANELADDEKELVEIFRQVEPWERELIISHAKTIYLHVATTKHDEDN